MKRIIIILLAIVATGLIFSCFTNIVNADEADVSWRFDEKTGTLTFFGQGKMAAETYPEWHEHKDAVKSVVIEEGVTAISRKAFSGFRSLTSVSVPNSLQEIGEYAFKGCIMLTQTPFTDNLTLIGASAFFGCSGIKEIVVPPKITTIFDGTFNGCTGLERVIFHSQITRIERNAFSGCSKLTEVQLPDSLTELGEQVFFGCTALKKVSLGNGVRQTAAFNYCTSLTEITIPDSVTAITTSAFANCSNLTKVNVGAGVSEISPSAFNFCPNLKEISVSQANPNFCSVQGVVYSKDRTKLIEIPEGYAGAYSVCADTVVIAAYAGHQCEKLTSLVIPDSVEIIEKYGFADCRALASVSLSKNLSEIGEFGFFYTALSQVTFPNTLTKIGALAFGRCTKLTDIAFTGKAPNIKNGAFEAVNATVRYPGNAPSWANIYKVYEQGFTEVITWRPVYCNGTHSEYTDKGTAATCTKSGLSAGRYCSVCGEVLSAQKTIFATGHRFGKWTQVQAATVDAPGLEKRTCSACGREEEKEIPILTNEEPKETEGKEKPTTEPAVSATEAATEPDTESTEETLLPTGEGSDGVENPPNTPTGVIGEDNVTKPTDMEKDQPQNLLWVAACISAVILLAAAGMVICVKMRKKA